MKQKSVCHTVGAMLSGVQVIVEITTRASEALEFSPDTFFVSSGINSEKEA